MGDIQWKKKHKKGEGKGQTRGIRGEGDLGVEEETQGARHGECGGEVRGVGCVDSVHCAHDTHTAHGTHAHAAVVRSDKDGVVLRHVPEQARHGRRDDVAAAVCGADDLRGDEHEVQQPPREKAAARRELEEAQRRVAQVAPVEPKTPRQRAQAQRNLKHHPVSVAGTRPP